MRCESHGVAARLVASVDDLEQIAAFGEKGDTEALRGWRRELFGEDALKLIRGELALSIEKDQVMALPTPRGRAAEDHAETSPDAS
jgi:ribonuclease D